MKTPYWIIHPDGRKDVLEAEMPAEPGYEFLAALIEPILREARLGAYLENVSVLYEGARRDLFVDDEGAIHRLPVNLEATRLYHALHISRGFANKDGLVFGGSYIYGVAVFFPSRQVWF